MGEAPIQLFRGLNNPMPVLIDDPAISTVFGLGQSHMVRDTEIDIAWLTGEAMNRHRAALAAKLGLCPRDLTDAELATPDIAISRIGIAGLSDAFCEGDTVGLDLAVEPDAQNGWKSVTTLRSHVAEPVRVTIHSRATSTPAAQHPHDRSGAPLSAPVEVSANAQATLPTLMRLIDAVEQDAMPAQSLHPVVVSREVTLATRPTQTVAVASDTRRGMTFTGSSFITSLLGTDRLALAIVETNRTAAGF